MAEKSVQEKIEDMNVAIKRKRSPLAAAFIEDEGVRLASEERSRAYVLKNEEEDTRMAPWMWNLLWFILGMLFMLTMPPSISNLIMHIGG